MRPAKTQFNQNVELEITYEQQQNYIPPKGLNVYFYDRKPTEKQENRVNASFFSTSINNELNSQLYLHDINKELETFGKYVRKDHLKHSDEPNLRKNPRIITHSILDESIFSGSRDRILSRAKDLKTVRLTEEKMREINRKVGKPLKNPKFISKLNNYKVPFGQITEDV